MGNTVKYISLFPFKAHELLCTQNYVCKYDNVNADELDHVPKNSLPLPKKRFYK
jgi:hypothetical protein